MKVARVVLLISFFGVLFICLKPVAAQSHVSMPAPPAQVTRPDSINDSNMYDYWGNMSAQGRAGGVLLGKLALEGEPLPWQPLLISVNCEGSVVNSTQTDTKGRFVITFTNTSGMPGTPEDAQRQMERMYEGCKVQAVLSGFRSTALTITQHNLRDEPNLGTIVLSPEGSGSGTEISETTHAAPAEGLKRYEKARAEWADQKPDAAERDLKKAVEIYPQFADAWLQLGKLQESSDPEEARNSFGKALAADPNYVLPYEQLAVLEAKQGKWKEALGDTTHALQLDPAGTPEIWYYDAAAKFYLGKTEAALTSAQKALAIDPRHTVAGAEQLLAVILARRADYDGALQHLRSSLTYLPAGPNADLVKQQIAQLERKKASLKK